jgi:hypothetical protein
MANLSLFNVSSLYGLSDRECLGIMLDADVEGVQWDCVMCEIHIKMRSLEHSISIQKYREDKLVNEFMKQIEGDGHAT